LTRSLFNKAIEQISAVTNRRFDPKQKELFYHELSSIGDVTFSKILKEYVREVPPPTNIIGYFLRVYENDKPVQPMYEDDKKSGWKNGEYTGEQQALFSKCYGKIMSLGEKIPLERKNEFAQILNREWKNKSGDSLTKGLRSCLGEIESW